ncbi:MAG: hypothetical protein DRR04_05350 [Gammaproteobacteria bacterium]|nr:MAG: hypothetical protein DRQ97_06855 [Gammaproteobacteria bacterium]RLA60554.1 MAG: hypothetical protein DRR04_05350 [Gammaproteobacteria bacterium]
MAASDVVLIGVLVFAAAIGLFAIFAAVDPVITSMEHSKINESSTAVDVLQGTRVMLGKLDYLVMGVFIALILGLIITSWFIGGNPLFMFVYFIVIVLAVIVAAILSNVWETVSGASVFGTTLGSFPLSNHIMLLLPYYIGVIGFIGIVIMFAKPYLSEAG